MYYKIGLDDWGYWSLKACKTRRAKKYVRIASFTSRQKIFDYARLYLQNTKETLIDKLDFTIKQKNAIKDIIDAVYFNYCSWSLFCENVVNSDKGLDGLLNLIDKGLTANKIVDQYI